jgi:hypothetical protein
MITVQTTSYELMLCYSIFFDEDHGYWIKLIPYLSATA